MEGSTPDSGKGKFLGVEESLSYEKKVSQKRQGGRTLVGVTGNSGVTGNPKASETGNVASSGKTTKQTPKKRQQGAKQDPPKCKLCSKPHRLYECDKFKALDVQDRWNKVGDWRGCFRCLGFQHHLDRCSYKGICGVDGCGWLHSTLLHGSQRQPAESDCAPALQGVHGNPHTFSVPPPPKAVPSAVVPSASDKQVNTMAAGRGDTTYL